MSSLQKLWPNCNTYYKAITSVVYYIVHYTGIITMANESNLMTCVLVIYGNKNKLFNLPKNSSKCHLYVCL